jgi:putative membrane protein
MNNKNVGSRARDHLANERTYLAWVRTTLGGTALGIALERFGADASSDSSAVLAMLIIGSSMFALALATLRYYRVARDLDEGRFVVDRRSPIVILGAAIIVTAVAVILAF